MLVEPQVELAGGSDSCKECRGPLVVTDDTGELLCRFCGMVSDSPGDWMANSPANAAAAANSAPREHPTSAMMYDLNLPTVIDSRNLDANGRRIQGTYELNQLRRWNDYTISREPKRNNQIKAMRDIDQIVRAAGLPGSVAIEACEIYRRRLKKAIFRRRSITSMAAATVLIACTLVGATFPAEELEKLKKTPNGRYVRYYHKLLLRDMNMRVTTVDPSRDVSRIAGKAGLSGKVERRSLEILAKVKDDPMLGGKRPASLAAAALYVASVQMGVRTNQMHLAFAAGVTPVTVRKRSVEMTMILDGATVSV